MLVEDVRNYRVSQLDLVPWLENIVLVLRWLAFLNFLEDYITVVPTLDLNVGVWKIYESTIQKVCLKLLS